MLQAFQPQGNTSLIAATTTASAGIQPSTGAIVGMRVATVGSGPAYLAFGSSTVAAALPTTSTPGAGFPIQPNSVETFNFAPNTWLSAITTGGTVQVYATAGFGV